MGDFLHFFFKNHLPKLWQNISLGTTYPGTDSMGILLYHCLPSPRFQIFYEVTLRFHGLFEKSDGHLGLSSFRARTKSMKGKF